MLESIHVSILYFKPIAIFSRGEGAGSRNELMTVQGLLLLAVRIHEKRLDALKKHYP